MQKPPWLPLGLSGAFLPAQRAPRVGGCVEALAAERLPVQGSAQSGVCVQQQEERRLLKMLGMLS